MLFYFLKKGTLFSLARMYNNLVDYNFINRDETFIFFYWPDPSRIQKLLIEYSFFHGKIIVFMVLIRICSPHQQNIIGNIGYITKALTGISYLRIRLIESNLNKHS